MSGRLRFVHTCKITCSPWVAPRHLRRAGRVCPFVSSPPRTWAAAWRRRPCDVPGRCVHPPQQANVSWRSAGPPATPPATQVATRRRPSRSIPPGPTWPLIPSVAPLTPQLRSPPAATGGDLPDRSGEADARSPPAPRGRRSLQCLRGRAGSPRGRSRCGTTVPAWPIRATHASARCAATETGAPQSADSTSLAPPAEPLSPRPE